MILVRFMPLLGAALMASLMAGACGQDEATNHNQVPVPVVSGEQGIDVGAYHKIQLAPSQLEVSTVYEHYGKKNLITGDDFWHASVPGEAEAEWVIVKLGSKARLDLLRVRPRPDHLLQLWSGDAATLEASSDGQEWIPQAKLQLNRGELNGREWITFVLPETLSSYAYYRLRITDPDFISMSGLELHGDYDEPVKTVPLVPGQQGIDVSAYNRIELSLGQIEVSSVFEHYSKDNLIVGDGFWHVDLSREIEEEWVVANLGRGVRLDILRVRPRPDYVSQLWSGDAAILEASNDGEEWITQARLKLNPLELNDRDWITFVFPETYDLFPLYRLRITDPNFVSMAELELYGEYAESTVETPGGGAIPVVTPE